MSNSTLFSVDSADGLLKRVRHRMSHDKTGESPILDTDRAAIRQALGIAQGQEIWGAPAVYTSDFSAGADSFATNTGLSAAAGNIDAITDGTTSKDDVLRLTTDATNGAHYAARGTGFTIGKRYRVEFSVYIPASQAFSKVRVGAGIIAAPPGASFDVSPTAGRWTDVSGEFTANAASTQIYLVLLTGANANTFQGVAGELAYFRNFKVYESGLKKILSMTKAIDFPSIAAAASNDQTVTLAGAAVGDSVHLGLPAAPQAGLIFQGFVSAADTVTIRATNITGSAVDAASATYRVTVLQF